MFSRAPSNRSPAPLITTKSLFLRERRAVNICFLASFIFLGRAGSASHAQDERRDHIHGFRQTQGFLHEQGICVVDVTVLYRHLVDRLHVPDLVSLFLELYGKAEGNERSSEKPVLDAMNMGIIKTSLESGSRAKSQGSEIKV
jgi:hypothetical protein